MVSEATWMKGPRDGEREVIHFETKESVYDAHVAKRPGCHGNLQHLWTVHRGERKLPFSENTSDLKDFVCSVAQVIFLLGN